MDEHAEDETICMGGIDADELTTEFSTTAFHRVWVRELLAGDFWLLQLHSIAYHLRGSMFFKLYNS